VSETSRAEPTIAVVGVSVGQTCGVRDHAVLLAEALAGREVASSMHWLWRSEGASLRGARSEMRSWTRALAAELNESPPTAVLLHYSVFSYSYRGLPLFVHPTLAAVRESGRPVLTALHEFAYPWRFGGLRGDVWALSQRMLLIDVMRASTAVIVTADFRSQWLSSRAWLPKRPLVVAPVFSNLPAPVNGSRPSRPGAVVGMFGYSYEGAAVTLVLDAIRALRMRGLDVELSLLGAPGPSSSAGESWRAAARSRGLTDALSFSGALPAQVLSDSLSACDVLLFADTSGPSSRKTTLAASLASGRPLVAIDGRRRWSELVRSDAARVVAPTSDALADAVGELLADEVGREALGARGREFAEREMSVAGTAEAYSALLADLTRRQPS
jgi:glycosyltransferase involved in cell wall biosynthesis